MNTIYILVALILITLVFYLITRYNESFLAPVDCSNNDDYIYRKDKKINLSVQELMSGECDSIYPDHSFY